MTGRISWTLRKGCPASNSSALWHAHSLCAQARENAQHSNHATSRAAVQLCRREAPPGEIAATAIPAAAKSPCQRPPSQFNTHR